MFRNHASHRTGVRSIFNVSFLCFLSHPFAITPMGAKPPMGTHPMVCFIPLMAETYSAADGFPIPLRLLLLSV